MRRQVHCHDEESHESSTLLKNYTESDDESGTIMVNDDDNNPVANGKHLTSSWSSTARLDSLKDVTSDKSFAAETDVLILDKLMYNDDINLTTSYSQNNENPELRCDDNHVSYYGVVRNNRQFQLYLLSYIITQVGEWLSYVASIELMEQILGPDRSSFSRRYVSYLVLCRLMPFLVISPFGGVLADVRDRRKSMIALDCVGILPPLFFFLAAHFMSIPIIFTVTIIQSTIAALYEPSRNAIIPLLVPEDEEMKKATTLTGLAWSVTAAFGAAVGGVMVSSFGIRPCFILDAITFVISALVLMSMEGEWDASISETTHLTPLQILRDMVIGGANYIKSSKFWPVIFVKVTASTIYGGADILNVSFSEEGHVIDEAEDSLRLGILFCCVGFGCLVGPLIADNWTSMNNMNSIMNACVIAFGVQAVGCIAMGCFQSFALIGLFTIVRSAGSSIAWIDSSVLLQSFSKADMLGRVMAVDSALALTGESLSALLVGIMQDSLGYTAGEVSKMMGYFAFFISMTWSVYILRGPRLE